jgi:alpha-L-fucosidase 2
MPKLNPIMNPVLTPDPASGDCVLFDVEPIANKPMYFVRYFFIMALIFISLIAGKSEGAEIASDDPMDNYNVVWTTPSENHNGSMPIGNGETGLNLWVEPSGDLVLLISRTDSWDENERLCKLGRVRIKFNPRLADGMFKQELKLRQGEIQIVGGPEGKSVTARIWVDANRQVIHVDADSESAFETQVDLDLWRKQVQTADKIGDGIDSFKGAKTIYPDTIVGDQKDRIVWYHRNPVSPWKETLELQGLQPALEVGTDPLLHRTFGGVIRGEGLVNVDDKTLRSAKPQKRFRLSIHTHTQVPATEEQWLKAIEATIVAADAVGGDEALKAHRTWWHGFWARSWVFATGNADAEAVTRGYVLQRWISAGAGRGNFPIKFNGSIFTVDEKNDPDYRRWGGCYWFQNTRLPYWPMLASGDYEMMRPLFRMFLDALPLAKIRTPIYFGHEGAFFPETMSFWGTYQNGRYGWGWRTTGKPGDPVVNKYIRFHYSGTLELLAMMIDYYEHTGDTEFLKKELLPIADSYLLWWDKHWGRDSNGKLHMYPSSACESFWECTNPTPDVAGLMWNLDRLLVLTDEEIGADHRTRWATFRKAIPSIPMTDIDGRPTIAPAAGTLPKRTNSENPELYAIFPFRLYGVGKPELDVASRTFERRGVKSNAGWRQDETQAAYLGLAQTAKDFLVRRAKSKHKESRFPAFWGPNFDWIPDQDHGANIVMGLQTMILQADDGKIRILPAWPKDWDLDFKLHAPHATVIEGRVRTGKLVDMKVTPESRRKDVVVIEPQ